MEQNLPSRINPDSVLSTGTNTLVIWRFSDGKPGHDSQSQGLANALTRITSCETHVIEAPTIIQSLSSLVRRQSPEKKGLPRPDVVIGAGHKTHLPVLATKYAHHCASVILMRPSFPYSWFDLCLVPDHDVPPVFNNVIPTYGALNTIVPTTDKRSNEGLILIGGPSRHFQWRDNDICSMVKTILDRDRTSWALFDSPRTPEKTRTYLNNFQAPNSRYFPYRSTPRQALEEKLGLGSRVWVTTDSVSMLYEALTAGAATGVLTVPPKRTNKIETAVAGLINDNQCVAYKDWAGGLALKPPGRQINEADRCAALVLKHLNLVS